jgi:ubiquinone/menaquinone biosynthesis C-methylase UbiE
MTPNLLSVCSLFYTCLSLANSTFMNNNYLAINKALWNKKTDVHIKSEFYGVDQFIAGKSSLHSIELDLLGDIKGKSVLHLQCHFGQDSLSLARMGAKVTGVDFSDVAIARARELNDKLSLDATFICTDIYSLPDVLNQEFDIVYTSYGTIGWLPDIKRWAEVVARFTRKGGQFIMAEFHPVVWMFSNDFSHIQYSYFNIEPIVETLNGTYADRSAPIAEQEIGWNHNLAELLQCLIDAGLQIHTFRELDYSPWNCFANTVETSPDRFQIIGLEGKLPMVYAIAATRG